MTKQLIVVTGGSGALGQQVVAELLRHGWEVLSLDRRPHPGGHKRSWVVDLLDSGSVYEACQGAAGIVHLAAHIAPDLASDCATFGDNVRMTYNVLKAATDNKLEKIVLASSTAVYGFLYGRKGETPAYLPADELHPTLPTDPYGLSKVVGERVADSFAARTNASITSLRFPGISYDPKYERVQNLLKDPGFRAPGFWSYVDVRDAAVAVRLALSRNRPGHRAYNIACDTSNMRQPTSELIQTFYPGLPERRISSSANWSGIDCSAARQELGFVPLHRWENAPAINQT
ncbi:MAG: NAD(P)-dependent oxidoreductase [Polaromonas sp.]|uniref:NAD-dependent epimerase/dehydratase family protein n=1 Tax=Polaromonas sp. TaxID=1869339 RepID=UPI0025DE7500|nr:NAD(P)-dependent oxidoreductase [Polaromonas sp.]MBI2727178.1 NAD(P)-dependent oxidoreductase [Polaromonas sp.]